MNLPAARFVAGKSHFAGVDALSVSAQFSRLTLVAEEFWISIQSEVAPSSSYRVPVLLAMNSVILTWAGAANETRAARMPASRI